MRIIIEKIVVTIVWTLCILLTYYTLGCSNAVSVPKEIKHGGEIKQTIIIEIAIPVATTNSIKIECEKTSSIPSEIQLCITTKQKEYTNTLLNLIQQFQTITKGSI